MEEYLEYFQMKEIKDKTLSNGTDIINVFCKSLDNFNIKKPDFYLDENEVLYYHLYKKVLDLLVNFG